MAIITQAKMPNNRFPQNNDNGKTTNTMDSIQFGHTKKVLLLWPFHDTKQVALGPAIYLAIEWVSAPPPWVPGLGTRDANNGFESKRTIPVFELKYEIDSFTTTSFWV
jgi:hypothetical protein